MGIFLALRILYGLALAASCTFAFRHGGRSERHGAAIILVGSLLTVLVEGLPAFDWRYSRQGLVAVDLGVLVAYFVLAQRSNRFWPLWTTAFQLIAVMTHLVIMVEPRRVLQAYAIAQGFWAYPMLASIVIGSIGSRRLARS
ncbi:hypothetical protein [uncultured Sphingomonas sp.]|uniref:hypothetical protein n=1 Tax=uncultured Sphingomonas sp. TaxID=158754 RepID=UPI0035CADF36